MQIVGLRGFGLRRYNSVEDCFTEGYFPQSSRSYFGTLNDWRPCDCGWLMSEFRSRFGQDPYLLIGFSDGGTLAHEIASADSCCAGLIVHSGMWRRPQCLTHAPVLLLRTIGDRTPTFQATGSAFHAYLEQNRKVSLETLSPTGDGYFRHQFANGVRSMARWCRGTLGFELPTTGEYTDE